MSAQSAPTSAESVAQLVRRHSESAPNDPEALVAALAPVLDAPGGATSEAVWLAWSAVRGELPGEDDVIGLRRRIALDGALTALSVLGGRADETVFGACMALEIVEGAVLVDVTHTSSTDSISGIQRVVRETVGRWAAQHPLVLVVWTADKRALRRLTTVETARILGTNSDGAASPSDASEIPPLVVPAGGRLIVAELAAEPERAERLLALGRFAATAMCAIGYDIVPLTSGETATPAIATLFPLYLEALAYADRVGTISASTAVEFEGWKRMLPASGRTGPDIAPVFLGGDSPQHSDGDDSRFAHELGLAPGEPFVLVVGSHEPRKNHLSVLNAARVLWDQGLVFRLVFIGSGAWANGGFTALADVLVTQGRHLEVLTGASDSLLAAAYRLADVSVFTSTHEGFGLPVVESLRSGTPVITSDVGSMREIAERYRGVLQVDPYDDRALEVTLGRVLHTPSELAALTADLATNDYRSWDDYAAELWDYLTGSAAGEGSGSAGGLN